MAVGDYPAQPGRHGYVVLKSVRPDQYTLVRDCPLCGKDARLQVPAQGLWDWEHGAFVQTAFPGMTPDQREQIMTGTHPACWDAMMGGEDDG